MLKKLVLTLEFVVAISTLTLEVLSLVAAFTEKEE